MKHFMWLLLPVIAGALIVGCANGAGKKIAQGAVRGASHGVIEKNVSDEVGRGAAHGALGAAHQVHVMKIKPVVKQSKTIKRWVRLSHMVDCEYKGGNPIFLFEEG